MKKKCTNSVCRKTFTLDGTIQASSMKCPYCGKKYPRMLPTKDISDRVVLQFNKAPELYAGKDKYYRIKSLSGESARTRTIRIIEEATEFGTEYCSQITDGTKEYLWMDKWQFKDFRSKVKKHTATIIKKKMSWKYHFLNS